MDFVWSVRSLVASSLIPKSIDRQTVGSLMKVVGPAITNTLFAVSVEKHYLGGNLVYIFLLFIIIVSLTTASLLPRELWNKSR